MSSIKSCQALSENKGDSHFTLRFKIGLTLNMNLLEVAENDELPVYTSGDGCMDFDVVNSDTIKFDGARLQRLRQASLNWSRVPMIQGQVNDRWEATKATIIEKKQMHQPSSLKNLDTQALRKLVISHDVQNQTDNNNECKMTGMSITNTEASNSIPCLILEHEKNDIDSVGSFKNKQETSYMYATEDKILVPESFQESQCHDSGKHSPVGNHVTSTTNHHGIDSSFKEFSTEAMVALANLAQRHSPENSKHILLKRRQKADTELKHNCSSNLVPSPIHLAFDSNISALDESLSSSWNRKKENSTSTCSCAKSVGANVSIASIAQLKDVAVGNQQLRKKKWCSSGKSNSLLSERLLCFLLGCSISFTILNVQHLYGVLQMVISCLANYAEMHQMYRSKVVNLITESRRISNVPYMPNLALKEGKKRTSLMEWKRLSPTQVPKFIESNESIPLLAEKLSCNPNFDNDPSFHSPQATFGTKKKETDTFEESKASMPYVLFSPHVHFSAETKEIVLCDSYADKEHSFHSPQTIFGTRNKETDTCEESKAVMPYVLFSPHVLFSAETEELRFDDIFSAVLDMHTSECSLSYDTKSQHNNSINKILDLEQGGEPHALVERKIDFTPMEVSSSKGWCERIRDMPLYLKQKLNKALHKEGVSKKEKENDQTVLRALSKFNRHVFQTFDHEIDRWAWEASFSGGSTF